MSLLANNKNTKNSDCYKDKKQYTEVKDINEDDDDDEFNSNNNNNNNFLPQNNLSNTSIESKTCYLNATHSNNSLIANLISKISIKSSTTNAATDDVVIKLPNCFKLKHLNNTNYNCTKCAKLYIHTNFMDTFELAYLLDFYINDNNCINNKKYDFICFLFGTKKHKENCNSIKSIVIPNKYINEYDFNLIEIINELKIYVRSMYKTYQSFEFIGWMYAGAKSGLKFDSSFNLY